MSDISTQLDFATMELKGQRYEKAEAIYMEIATNSKSPEAWVGMGICKLYQLANGRTMDEVVFCMDKAIKINPSIKIDVENQLILTCQTLLNTYLAVYEESLKKHEELKQQAKIGAIIAGVSILAGTSSNNNTFSTIASLAGTGAGVGVAVDAINEMGSVQQIQSFLIQTCDKINISLSAFVDSSNPNLANYTQYVNNLIESVKNSIENSNQAKINSGNPNWDGSQWWMNKTTVIILTILFWPVGLYGFYMRSKNK